MTNTSITPEQRKLKLGNEAYQVYEDKLIKHYVEYSHNLCVVEKLRSLSNTLDTIAWHNNQLSDDNVQALIDNVDSILESYTGNEPIYQYQQKNKIALAELNKTLDEIYATTKETPEDAITDAAYNELLNIPSDLHLYVEKEAADARVNADLAEAAADDILVALKFAHVLRERPNHLPPNHKTELKKLVDVALKSIKESEKYRDSYLKGTDKEES